jgi:hypothetical protein
MRAWSSRLGTRLFFQLVSAAGVAVALWLIWRRTREPGAVAAVGINPVVASAVVNAGHNDALVGLAIMGAALLVERRRPALAGVAIAGGALVKPVALLPAAALAWWLWRRAARGDAARFAVPVAALVGGCYLAVGARDALSALGTISRVARPYSVLGAIRTALPGTPSATAFAWCGFALSLIAGAALAAAAARRGGPATTAGVALLPSLLLGTYVLPWYAIWVLPALALRWRSVPAGVAVVAGVVLSFASWPYASASYPAPFADVPAFLARVAVPVALAAGAVLVLLARRAAVGPA